MGSTGGAEHPRPPYPCCSPRSQGELLLPQVWLHYRRSSSSHWVSIRLLLAGAQTPPKPAPLRTGAPTLMGLLLLGALQSAGPGTYLGEAAKRHKIPSEPLPARGAAIKTK